MSFYLSNALGFFIQLMPCAVLIFLPFPEETIRVPKKRVLTGTVLVAGVLAALFPLVLRTAGLEMLGDLLMLLAAVLTLAAAVWLVEEPPLKKLLVFFVVLFHAVAQFWMVNTVWLFLPERLFMDRAVYGPYPPMTTVLYAVCAAVTLPVVLRCVIRPLGNFLREMEPGEMRREFAAAILSTTAFVVAMMYVYNYGYNRQFYHVTVLLELLLLLEQLLLYWLLFQESLRRKRDSEKQRALEVQKLQYDKISREMENTRRLRHDLRHHMNVLGALNAQGRQAEVTAYLKEYGAVVERLDRLKFSGYPVVDGVLGYYLAQAEDLSAKVEYDVALDSDSGVEATDMTVLLGNCLENSLEALRKLPEDRRRFSVELRTANTTFLIRIRNTCVEQDDTGDPADWTAFADSGGDGLRGVGLSSVSAIAEKYNGSALFQRRDGVFTTRIILNPKQNPE